MEQLFENFIQKLIFICFIFMMWLLEDCGDSVLPRTYTSSHQWMKLADGINRLEPKARPPT